MKAVWLMILLALVAGAPHGVAQPAQPSSGVSPAESPQAVDEGTQNGQSASPSSTEPTHVRGRQEAHSPVDLANKVGDQAAKSTEKRPAKAPKLEPADPEPAPSMPASLPAPKPTLPSPSDDAIRTLSNSVPVIEATLEELRCLVIIGIRVGLIGLVGIFVNFLASLLHPRLRRRDSQDSSQGEPGREVVAQVEPPLAKSLPPSEREQEEAARPIQSDEPPAPPPPVQVPRLRPVEREEKKPLPPPPGPDEFAELPHAAIGRALRQLHTALPDLARRIPDPRQQERFLADLQAPLEARIERFKEGARLGDNYLREHWIEQDLVITLNFLAQWLSSAIEERKRGRRGNRLLEEELSRWLYERLAPVCRDEGWFAVESILPFTTRFDPKIHYSVGSVSLEGATNLVVTIKAIGRRDLRQNYVTHKAEVIVGR